MAGPSSPFASRRPTATTRKRAASKDDSRNDTEASAKRLRKDIDELDRNENEQNGVPSAFSRNTENEDIEVNEEPEKEDARISSDAINADDSNMSDTIVVASAPPLPGWIIRDPQREIISPSSRSLKASTEAPPKHTQERVTKTGDGKEEREEEEEKQGSNEGDEDEAAVARAARYFLVKDIVAESRTHFVIDWEDDPHTGEKFEPTIEPKRNATDMAVADWRRTHAVVRTNAGIVNANAFRVAKNAAQKAARIKKKA